MLFKHAAFEEASCAKLIYSLNNQDLTKPVFAAYKASGLMMNAKYVGNPLDKLSTFSKGKNLLEQTVSKAPTNLEIRFLRLAMQSNAPAFLGYSDAISRDKTFILQGLKTESDTELKNMIISFLEKSDILTKKEKFSLIDLK
jgi:hypothetical protein